MEFIRINSTNHGTFYVRPDHIVSIAATEADNECVVGVVLPNGHEYDLIVESDPDEVAQAFERVLPGTLLYLI